jgi:RHS repeat-associated protein
VRRDVQKLLASLCALVLALLSVEAIAGTVTYFHNDALGSPISATDDRGVVIWKESYRPYGDRLTNSASASGNKIWFTSRRQDPETGLVYMGARFYDPAAGRFVSTDQVGFAEKNVQSFNRYAYANDNPYKYADPNGKSPLIAWGGGGYGAGVLAYAASQYAAWGSVDWKLALSSSAAQMGAFAGLLGAADSVGLTIEEVGGAGAGAAGEISTSTTREVIERVSRGADGAISHQIVERENGEAISRIHRVTKDGEVVHQHHNSLGKSGGVRQFPDQWTGTETVHAPYENAEPQFKADRQPGGRTF